MPNRPQGDFLQRTVDLARTRWGVEIDEDTAHQWAKQVCGYIDTLNTISRLDGMEFSEEKGGGGVVGQKNPDGELAQEEPLAGRLARRSQGADGLCA